MAQWMWIHHLFRHYLATWHIVATRSLCPTQDEHLLYYCTTMTWPFAWEYKGKTARWRDEKAGIAVLSLPLCEHFGVHIDLRHFNHMLFFLLIVPFFSPTSSQLKHSIFVQSITLLLAFAPPSPPLYSVLRLAFCWSVSSCAVLSSPHPDKQLPDQ